MVLTPGNVEQKLIFLLLMVACSGRLTAQQSAVPLGELFPGDATTGLVQPATTGMSVAAGSELSAGVSPALFKLQRGGQVRICPHSTVTVNSGRYGLMFAMSSGMVEIDYTVTQRGTDFILTPDFSIQLSGPGRYHFALGANTQGDTCMKSLAGNSSAVMVSEQIGSASYRVRPQDSVLFHDGKVNGNTPLEREACGCPAPEPMQEAGNQPSPVTGAPGQAAPASRLPVQNNPAEPLPSDRPGQIHVEVDTPFVFNARESSIKPYSVAKLRLSSLPNVFFVQETVDPIVLQDRPTVVPVRDKKEVPEPKSVATPEKAAQNKEKKGFFGKLKGMFSGLFHR